MGKGNGKWSKYEKKYKKAWESLPEMKGWLKEAPANHPKAGEALCNVCSATLRPQLADLKKHACTKIHRDNIARLNKTKQPSLESLGVATTSTVSAHLKEVDLQLALFIAMHSSIRSIDHLGELLKKVGKGSKLEDVRLHRTKCSMLIKSVIAPAMLTSLIEDVGNEGYSLIIDESTDVSVSKYMCLCIRYFSKARKQIVTDYLGIVEVVRATADDLFASLCSYLDVVGLKLANIIGLGTDGGSNLCGKNHSVFTLIRERVPNVQLVKCVCHSIHLCSSKAAEELPSSVDFLIRETYSWFSVSSLRRHTYSEVYSLINDEKKPLNLVHLSATRWLSRYEAVSRILDQWLELKTHFVMAAQKEKCYSARLLAEMFNDDTNYLYLLFIKPILHELNNVNLNFQHTNADVTKVYDDLKSLYLLIARKVIKPSFLDLSSRGNVYLKLDDISCVNNALTNPLALQAFATADYGYMFELEVAKENVSTENLNIVKTRCFRFLVKLCEELTKRLPENVGVLNKLKHFSPGICLNQTRPNFPSLQVDLLRGNDRNKLDVMESQWHKLLTVIWAEHFPTGKVPVDTETFWVTVRSFTDAGGRLVFEELSNFVLRLLSLPLSNAVVERAFSVMNSTKTKARNRLNMRTLDALMRIRIHSTVVETCCNTFKPTAAMFELFTSAMYINLMKMEAGPSTETAEEEQSIEEYLELFPADTD